LKKSAVRSLIYVYVFLVLLGMMYPFLDGRVLGGWDLTPQYYLYEICLKSLMHFKVTGYDFKWFGGYPSFSCYGFIPYIIPALLEMLVVKPLTTLISIESPQNFWIFNLFIFSLPYLFIWAMCFCGKCFFGKESRCFIVIFSLFYLTTIGDSDKAPFGLYAGLFHGHIAAFCGSILSILLLAYLQILTFRSRTRDIIMAGVVFGLLIMTHTLSTVFGLFIMGVFVIAEFSIAYVKRIILVFVIGLAVSSFWIFPFIMNMGLTSSHSIPEIGTSAMQWIFPDLWMLRKIDYTSITWFFMVPVPGIILFFCTMAGLRNLFLNKSIALPLCFLLTTLLLSGNFFYAVLKLPIHYYRFTMLVYPLMILVSSAGAAAVYNFLCSGPHSLKETARVGFFFIIFWGLLIAGIRDYNFTPEEGFYSDLIAHISATKEMEENLPKLSPVNSFEEFPEAMELIEYLSKSKLTGRVAVETAPLLQKLTGSIHFFNTFLPFYDISIVPGLLAESSLSAPYLIPLLAQGSNSLLWGKKVFPRWENEYYGQTQNETIKRLQVYDVEYILAITKKYKRFLDTAPPNLLEIKERFGSFALYHVKELKGLFSAPKYKPILYIRDSGPSFRDFCEDWWEEFSMLDFTFIYTDKRFETLPEYEKSQIGAIVISKLPDAPVSAAEFEKYKAFGRPFYFLGGVPWADLDNEVKSHFLTTPNNRSWKKPLRKRLSELSDFALPPAEAPAGSASEDSLHINATGPVLINFSYFPRWKSNSPSQNVYMATPSLMLVFSQGTTELAYR
jgi:hypothetical protein